jgi:hypothetical protein
VVRGVVHCLALICKDAGQAVRPIEPAGGSGALFTVRNVEVVGSSPITSTFRSRRSRTMRLPFVDPTLLARADRVPLRTGARCAPPPETAAGRFLKASGRVPKPEGLFVRLSLDAP